ncbi:MAG: pyridoxal phosphate-dependent aminotransferase [Eggerthellaceae bacterium]|nr:pyridoxal phosphate-dependent aminotransferase [Eggerthellaceae bacterium]
MPLTTKSVLNHLEKSAIRRFAVMGAETPGCIGLTLGQPDANTADVIKEQVTIQLAANDTHYPPNNGKPFLRQAIADYERTLGLEYDAEEIILTIGATEAVFLTLSTLLDPGDEVIILKPAYTLYASVTGLNSAIPVYIDTAEADYQVTPEMLAKAVSPRTKAIVINSPNNPTGCILNAESLDAIADAARDNDFYVVCDDVYERLVYVDGFQSFAQRHPELRDRTIVCNSFSKPYAMTGWRLGWVAADEAFVLQAGKIHQFMISCAPSFVQNAAAVALQQDVEPARQVYLKRRELVLNRFDDMGLDVVRPDGAFYALPSIEKYGIGSDELCERLIKEAGVAFIPGSCFGAEGRIRLSYCCSLEAIDEGLRRLDGYLKKL